MSAWQLLLNWGRIFDELDLDAEEFTPKDKRTVFKDIEKEYSESELLEMEGEELDAIVISKIRKVKKLPAKKPKKLKISPDKMGKPIMFPVNLDLDPSRPLEEQIREAFEDMFEDGQLFDQMADFFRDMFGGDKKRGKRKRKSDDSPIYT